MKNVIENMPQTIKQERMLIAEKTLKSSIDLKSGDTILILTDKNTNPEIIHLLQKLADNNHNNCQILNVKSIEDKNKYDASAGEKEVEEKISNLSTIHNDPKSKKIDLSIIKLCETFPIIGKAYDEWLKKYQYRLLNIPGLRPEMFDENSAVTEETDIIEWRLNKMENELNKAEIFHITSSYGTNLTIGLRPFKDRKWIKETGKLNPGQWGNIPSGEIFTTPDEHNVNGVLMLPVLDFSVNNNQGVDKFVRITVRDGVITSIEGGESAKQLRNYLEEQIKIDINNGLNSWNARRIAEIAFGANSKARSMALDPSKSYTLIGTPTIEGEKRLGTMHLAFGNSQHGEKGADGFEISNSHLDFVIPKNGLNVKMFSSKQDFKSGKNSQYLIRDGGFNLGF